MSTQVAGEVFLDVCERLAFMFGEPVDREGLPIGEGDEWARAHIDFEGVVSGSLVLVVPRPLCLEFAANILGLDPEDLDYGPVSVDALCELLNVVAGHVVRALQGEDHDFRLSVPSYDDLAEDGYLACLDAPDTFYYDLDDNPVLLTLTLN